jgi:hypothetical protein
MARLPPRGHGAAALALGARQVPEAPGNRLGARPAAGGAVQGAVRAGECCGVRFLGSADHELFVPSSDRSTVSDALASGSCMTR